MFTSKTVPASMKFERCLLLPIALVALMAQVCPTLAANYADLSHKMQYANMMIFTLPEHEAQFTEHVLEDPTPTMLIIQQNREAGAPIDKDVNVVDGEWPELFVTFRDRMEELVRGEDADNYKLKDYNEIPLKLASVECKKPSDLSSVYTGSDICDDLIYKGEMPFYGFAVDGELHYFHGFSDKEDNEYDVNDHVQAHYGTLCTDAETCDHDLSKKYLSELETKSVDELEIILKKIKASRDGFLSMYTNANDFVVSYDEKILEAESMSRSNLRWTWKRLQMLYKYAREQGDSWANDPSDEYDTGVTIHQYLEVPSKVGSSHPEHEQKDSKV